MIADPCLARQDMPDEEALRLILEGQTAVYRVLVDRYKSKAISVAYAYTRNFDDAKDLAQDAFVKVYQRLAQFRGQSKFYTWFYRILINQCKDFLKKRRESPLADASVFERIESGRPAARDEISAREAGENLTRALEVLSFRQRVVIVFSYFQDATIAQLAGILGVSEGTVKATKFQALRKLKKECSYLKEILP